MSNFGYELLQRYCVRTVLEIAGKCGVNAVEAEELAKVYNKNITYFAKYYEKGLDALGGFSDGNPRNYGGGH